MLFALLSDVDWWRRRSELVDNLPFDTLEFIHDDGNLMTCDDAIGEWGRTWTTMTRMLMPATRLCEKMN